MASFSLFYTKWSLLIGGLIFVYLLPIWLFPYFPTQVGIFVNAANYYCLDNGGINLGNYEIQFDYFPVRFNSGFERPLEEKEWLQIVHWQPEKIDICDYADNVDYLLLWGTPAPYRC